MTALEQPSVKPDEPKDPSHYFAVWLKLLMVLGLVAFFAARPVQRLLQGNDARRLVEEAVAFHLQHEPELVAARFAAALRLAPRDPEILRAAARSCSTTLSPLGLDYWQVLLNTSDGTREDWLEYVDFALDLGRTDLAHEPLAKLIGAEEVSSDVFELLVRHWNMVQRPDLARLAATIWHETFPEMPASAIALARMIPPNGDPTNHAARAKLLLPHAMAPGPRQAECIEVLLADAGLPRLEARVLLSELSALKDPPLPVRLATATLRAHVAAPGSTPNFSTLLTELPKSLNDEDLELVGNWLIERGGANEALQLVPLERAYRAGGLLTVRLRALAARDQWAELQTLLSSDAQQAIPAYLTHCFKAAMENRQGRPHNVAGHLETAIRTCGKDTVGLDYVARYAETLDQPLAAIHAYEALMPFPGYTLTAGRQILRLAGPVDTLRAALPTIRRLWDFAPQDPGIIELHAYASFVVEEHVPGLFEALSASIGAAPTDLPHRCLLALGLLRRGDAAAALNLIESTDIEWEYAPAKWLAVRVAILGSTGQREAVRQLARRIDAAQLKLEERGLIEPWLR